LRLSGILNDPFCCMTLLAIEWSHCSERGSDAASDDCRCFWMARKSPENYPFSLEDLHSRLIHVSLGPPESSSKTASQSVQPFLYLSQILCSTMHC